ncbi:hypothetical protein PPROV_001105300 [Pycnococcus provasolii]|uniref:TIR domain-containing protein n=2 Tax=Pycnococcus provasolii TaxID=41880 RepID=A0A830I0C8_9CHLO|nr:hypothetical protein PPROV_001105300 [Pycnococcus provasolii]
MGCGASTESDGLTELHDLIIVKNWDGVRARIQSNPGEVRQKNFRGWFPLHWAAYNKAPLDVVRYLVEKYPDSVREKTGSGGSLPLHMAAAHDAPLDVVRYLVEQYPQGVHVRGGHENKTSLELAERYSASSEVVAYLKQAETAGNHRPPPPSKTATAAPSSTTSSVASKPHHSEAAATVSHINSPGAWDVFISHCQRDANAVVMAEALFASFEKRGLRVWLDVKMKKRDVAAMEEGAKNSTMVIAIVTGGGDNPDHAFFRREFCLQELRWAQSVGASIQPVITVDDKKRIGEFLSAAPSDLQALGQVDWIDMNRGAVQYWEVGVDMLEERLEEARATRQRQR